MCGRYLMDEDSIHRLQDLSDYVNGVFSQGTVRPQDTAPVLCLKGDHLYLTPMKWGFTAAQKSSLVINARSESVFDKPMFKDAVKSRRCVLGCREFYEWNKNKEMATFTLSGQGTIYLAGIWSLFPDGERFTILTTKANASMAPVHDRMPLMLTADQVKPWILDKSFTKSYLSSTMPLLERSMAYEQLSLFS